MHIPDGLLPASVCIAGYATTGALTWYALYTIQRQDDPQAGIPRASLLTAAFFVASWIHILVPPTSVHLMLSGLLGVLLGYYAMPAILIGLFLQAIMFQHGGLTTLGVNATIFGVPALLAGAVFRLRRGQTSRILTGVCGFVAGAGGVALAVLIFYSVLITTIPLTINVDQERVAITALALAHIPLMVLEGLFTMLVVLFLQRVRPELLDGPARYVPPVLVSASESYES